MPTPFEYETQVAGETVNIYGDGWEFHGPAWLAWRIRSIATRLITVAEAAQTTAKNAVQFHALGGQGSDLASRIMDDEWYCGNGPRPGPHPHWTDTLLELALYADSLPAASSQRASALALAHQMLERAAKAD